MSDFDRSSVMCASKAEGLSISPNKIFENEYTAQATGKSQALILEKINEERFCKNKY